MADNKFYQFCNLSTLNAMSNSAYSSHPQRQNGVGTGMALSSLHNKLFYQVSTITSALAEVMKNNGYDMGSSIESSWSATVTQLSNIVTKAFLTANHYTKAETQSYVTGLLSLYDLSTVVDSKISTAISGINVTGGGATVANINDAINNAFNTAGSTTILGGTTFHSKRATETEIQNGTGGQYICPSTLKASKYVPILDPSGSDYLIYSEGGYWVRKAWATLSSGFLSASTRNLDNYYTREVSDGKYALKTNTYTMQEASDNFTTPAEVASQVGGMGFLKPSDIASSKSDDGYIKIPSGSASSGIQICWGSFALPSTIGSQTGRVSFASNFTSCFAVTLSGAVLEVSDDNSWLGIVITAKGTSYFEWKAQDRGNSSLTYKTVYYIAIGSY
jgi:hypothetical protein